VLAHVGSGGMGDVYRARDVRLDRPVAIKVLAPRLVGDSGFLERFGREARAIARLSHRNICTLYDLGHEDASAGAPAIDYLVLEFIDGETLADRLRHGPLPVHEALLRAIDICDALAHAHAHGIVHGDVKPGNVILTGTGATLVDFGLAKRPTDSRPVLGTLPYMSPEQIAGAAIDARADVWAFAVVLYEMLSGRRAFGGATGSAIASAILETAPDSLAAVPSEVERLIRSCLTKVRADRRLTAQQIADRLRALTKTTTPAPWKKSASLAAAIVIATAVGVTKPAATPTVIAEKPSSPVSGEDRDLAGVTTSSIDAYRFYAEGVNLHERGRDLEAARQLRQAVRIDPTFAMALAKLAITEAAPGVMDMAAARRDSERALAQSARLPERERLYVEGIYRHYRGDLEGSIASLQHVLTLDPDHISSRQTLAVNYAGLERYREAVTHFEQLRRRGVPMGISYFGLSQAYEALGDMDKAIAVVEEFLRRNPDDAPAYRRLSEALIRAGRLEDATQAAERAEGLGERHATDDLRRIVLLLQDRLSEAEAADRARLKVPDTSHKREDSFRLAFDMLFRGRATEARKIFATVDAWYWTALLDLDQGDANRALARVRRVLPRDRVKLESLKNPEVASLVGRAHALLGHRAEAAAVMDQMSRLADGAATAQAERRLRWTRGIVALEMRDVDTAVSELTRAAALLPPNPLERGLPILYALACAEFAAGRDADARALFQQLVASSARTSAPLEFIRSVYFLATIADRHGEAVAAKEYYTRFLWYWGDGDLDRERVAEARQRLGDLRAFSKDLRFKAP